MLRVRLHMNRVAVTNNEKKTEENNIQVLKGFLIITHVNTPCRVSHSLYNSL